MTDYLYLVTMTHFEATTLVTVLGFPIGTLVVAPAVSYLLAARTSLRRWSTTDTAERCHHASLLTALTTTIDRIRTRPIRADGQTHHVDHQLSKQSQAGGTLLFLSSRRKLHAS
uniref:Uncharacterized protein n=1 Tax=Anopheles maculatus TaxID=74869 RepID=A0A182S9Y2_9DIPT